jgi:hypothetical protein
VSAQIALRTRRNRQQLIRCFACEHTGARPRVVATAADFPPGSLPMCYSGARDEGKGRRRAGHRAGHPGSASRMRDRWGSDALDWGAVGRGLGHSSADHEVDETGEERMSGRKGLTSVCGLAGGTRPRPPGTHGTAEVRIKTIHMYSGR